MKLQLTTIILLLLMLSCSKNSSLQEQSILIINSDSAEIFAKDLVSTPLAERDGSLSPSGDIFFYTISSFIRPTIVFVKRTSNGWQKPEVAPFSGVYSDLEPHFSPDGKRLYFSSNRPIVEGSDTKDFDIWYVERIDDSWSSPVNIGSPINTEANEFYPSTTNNGTLYWCATRNDKFGIGGEDIYFSAFTNGKYENVQVLSDSINTPADEFNAFIARDESYIIFTSSGWGNGYGRGDLWISYRHNEGYWSKPINMGPTVNSSGFEYCPSVSECGKYLFFTSDRTDISSIKSPISYQDIINFSNQPKNRLSNIYIVNAQIIKTLNPYSE